MTGTPGPPVGPPAGWYADPHGRPVLRWWDGWRWTEHAQAMPQPRRNPCTRCGAPEDTHVGGRCPGDARSEAGNEQRRAEYARQAEAVRMTSPGSGDRIVSWTGDRRSGWEIDLAKVSRKTWGLIASIALCVLVGVLIAHGSSPWDIVVILLVILYFGWPVIAGIILTAIWVRKIRPNVKRSTAMAIDYSIDGFLVLVGLANPVALVFGVIGFMQDTRYYGYWGRPENTHPGNPPRPQEAR
jgi:hypothetical protein